MDTETIRSFIDNINSGNNIDAKQEFHKLIGDKVMDVLAARKQELASTIYSRESDEVVPAV
jgi:hypothetical protein